MFSAIRRAFGFIKVYETDTDVVVSGVPADILARDISKMWSTNRINSFLFTEMGRSEFSFPKFFALEVHYMLRQIDEYRNARSSSRIIRTILHDLETETWLKTLTQATELDKPLPSRVDMSQLSKLKITPFPHQSGFLKAYGELTEKYQLNGYLLAADPGTGKAQPLDAPIRVPGGWSTMGKMTVGTKVIARDGTTTEVTGVFPQGEKLIYEVSFVDGRTVECCGEHLWKVRQWRRYKLIGTRPASDEVIDTHAILEMLEGEGNKVAVPLATPEDGEPVPGLLEAFQEAAGSLPAGYLDGSLAQRRALLTQLLKSSELTYSTPHPQLAKEVQRLVWSLGGMAILSRDDKEHIVDFLLPVPGYPLYLKITSVKPIGKKPAQCIMLAHPEHLYVTKDYIPTHNTIMGLALAECLHSDLVVIVSPKNALRRVWTGTIDWLYKKPQAYWVPADGEPYKRQRLIVTHYEALDKVLPVVKGISASKAVVILDESHNLNEERSNRTKLFLEVCKATRSQNILWSSGTPLKAMGYEMIPLLRSIDPLFTEDVERRFLKVFGKASDRALDILRNRIGKVSYHVAGKEVIQVETHSEDLRVAIPNAKDYTLDSVKDQMKAFVESRLAFYKNDMESFEAQYEKGLRAFEAHMPPGKQEDYRHYLKVIHAISKGYDPKQHKEDAVFANHFELKYIAPAIPDKADRDAFRNARSVIKYVKLKVVGEALGSVVGKLRAQCHIDMVSAMNWREVAEKSVKKVLVFSSYVEVIKAADEKIRQAGFKTVMVYGDTNANVAGIVAEFAKNDQIKFCLATYQSLSTAVPMTMADLTVFVNQPFRSYEKDQAEARTARIGQDSPVYYINTFLDTGDKPNISTRSRDILDWSREMVMAMIGPDNGGIAAKLNKEYNLESLESYSNEIPPELFPSLTAKESLHGQP